MKLATYFILVVATICVLITVISMIIAAFQIVVYIAAAVLLIWSVTQIAIFVNKKSNKQPPS